MRRIRENLEIEKANFPLFFPVILGIGILLGVYFPLKILFALLLLTFTLSIKFRKYFSICFLVLLGFYIAQTGGILKTDLLINKKFLEKDYDKVSFFADVDFIEETHPIMKGMQRIVFRNISFGPKYNLDYIKTAKMTCHSNMLQNIETNDRVKVFGRLMKYKIAAIPGSFDQKQYNSLIGLDATGAVFHIKKVKTLMQPRMWRSFSYVRRVLTKSRMEKFSAPANGIAAALLTGDKSAIPPEIRDKFIKSGTAHILAISGLHMSVVSAIIFFIFSKIFSYLGIFIKKLNFQIAAAICTIPTTFVYLGLSGFSPSAVRAFIMTTVCFVSLMRGKKVLSLRSVSLAAFIILLFDPASLFLVSFQLSFCAVVALISFYENFQKFLSRLYWHSNIFSKFASYILLSVITTIIASLATFPISVSTFNRLSLTGILGNIIAIPLISFIIAPLGIFCIMLSKLFSFFPSLLETVLNLLVNSVGFVSELPGSDIAVRSPHIFTLYICVFGGIILCLLKTNIKHFGNILIAASMLLYYFEKSPNIIIPPDAAIACFIENGKFYTTSLKSGRNKVLAIQRNLGFSGDLVKKDLDTDEIDIQKYEKGLFIFKEGGSLERICQIANRVHPYCPAYFESVE